MPRRHRTESFEQTAYIFAPKQNIFQPDPVKAFIPGNTQSTDKCPFKRKQKSVNSLRDENLIIQRKIIEKQVTQALSPKKTLQIRSLRSPFSNKLVARP